MKKVLLVFMTFFAGNILLAQSNSNGFPISVAYFGQLAFQPGVKVSTDIALKEWTKTEKYIRNLFLSPQIAIYTRPNNSTSFLINADIGYKKIKTKNNFHSVFSIGLGYLTESKITSLSVNLSDGKTSKNRTSSTYFMPTITYQFGKMFNDKMGWYSKYSYGFKMDFKDNRTAVLFAELGLRFFL